MILTSPTTKTLRGIPLAAIVLLAVAIHGPLLLMQLPVNSYDTNTHLFFAKNYADHWFNPWNEKWFAGFSQTTYPPLTHQWIALFSHVLGLNLAYMFVQLIVIMLLPIGMYRYAQLWVDERSASFAALGTVFLGSLAMLVYQAGQLPTTFAAALLLNALPYFYEWTRTARGSALLKGFLLMAAAAAGHHVTVLFGMPLFFFPVLWLAVSERHAEGADSTAAGVVSRAVLFVAVTALAIALVLLPYFWQLRQNPITQQPIPHGSRDNYLLNLRSGLNFWVVPMGALILALPFVFWRGATQRRLRPLFVGFYLTLLLGLGGTTPVGKLLLQRAFEVLTFERFTFWATLMMMPIVGLLAFELMARYGRKAMAGLAIAAVFTFGMAVSWMTYNPITGTQFDYTPVVQFLNRDDHSKFRYLLLGFGNQFSRVTLEANASTVDGDYNSARLLPEMTRYGAGRLDSAKHYGANGMESLRAMLKHANQYGLKYVFVRDRYYEPLLAFAGWRQVESYDNGNVTLWSKEDIQPARRIESNMVPTLWERILWGTLPILVSLLALAATLLLPDRRRVLPVNTVEFPPAEEPEPVLLREAK